jgi:phage/plasmid-like protein (TIGR03299 family)|tara:strand:- start:290 stop:1399 length:1110 start_codon:yes stop_codon:yes gene_type:complete
MAHQIERLNGRESFAFTGDRKLVWHGLGENVSDAVTAQEMLVAANLDWRVELAPVYNREHSGMGSTSADNNGKQLVDDLQFVERWIPNWKHYNILEYYDTLGVVGSTFQAVQNYELAEVLSKVSATPTSDLKWTTAGSLRGGRDVFFVAELPDDGFAIDGDQVDQIDSYLVAHDNKIGQHSLRIFQTSVRPVCMNTLVASFGKATQSLTIRHSGDMQQKIKQVHGALAKESARWDRYRTWLGSLSQVDIDLNRFGDIVNDMWKVDLLDIDVEDSKLSARQATNLNKTRSDLIDNYAGERGQTLYHAFQAGTEYLQHGSKQNPKNLRSDDSNFASVLTGDTNKKMWKYADVIDRYAVKSGLASFHELAKV